MTADGLRIQIVDELKRPMFDSGSAVVQPYMRELLRAIGSVLAEVPNRHHARRPHRRRGLRRRAARLQQLGAVGRPRQRLAPRADRRRPAAEPHAARAGPGRQPAARREQDPQAAGEPAHQHHRDEPRRRGPLLRPRARGRAARQPSRHCPRSGPTSPPAALKPRRRGPISPLQHPAPRASRHEPTHRPEVPDRRRFLDHAPHRARPAQGDGLQQRRRGRGRRRRAEHAQGAAASTSSSPTSTCRT